VRPPNIQLNILPSLYGYATENSVHSQALFSFLESSEMVVFILGCTGSPLKDVAKEKNKKATHFFAWEWWPMASQYAWHCNPSLQLMR
jgi:hypothetical protein